MPAAARLNAIQHIEARERLTAPANFRARADTTAAWKFIGPRPIDYGSGYLNSGRITAMAVDPRNNDVVYAGGADGASGRLLTAAPPGLHWATINPRFRSARLRSILPIRTLSTSHRRAG